MDGENNGFIIANLEDLPKIQGESPPPQACPAIREFIRDKHQTTNWLGIMLVLAFTFIEFIVLIEGVFITESFDELTALFDMVKDQWGTILGFVLGYYFANRGNANDDSQS